MASRGRLRNPVRLSSPVVGIERAQVATVRTQARSYRARQVIVTVPKSVTAAVRFDPVLPPARAQYFQRQPTGATVKIQAVYDTPFWRPEGLSGSVVSDTGPLEVVYDNSPPDARRGVLVGFAEGDNGRSLFGLTDAARRSTVLASLARYYGDRAANPVDYVDMVWAKETYSGGAYGSYNPPGVITSLAATVSGPVGNLYLCRGRLLRGVAGLHGGCHPFGIGCCVGGAAGLVGQQRACRCRSSVERRLLCRAGRGHLGVPPIGCQYGDRRGRCESGLGPCWVTPSRSPCRCSRR